MLTLADGRQIGAFAVFRDTLYEGGRRSYTSRFYALPEAPRLARDPDGGPAFDFLWYRTPPGADADGAGGVVTLTVDLGLTSEERTMLQQAIPAAYPSESLLEVEILPVPFRDGTVDLTFAGESGGTASDGEFAAQVGGSGPARLAGSERATFAVAMTRDGAALLWQAIDDGVDLFHVRYDLLFEAHLDDIELRVWCDVQTSVGVVLNRLAAGSIDPGELRESLTSDHLAGIELLADRPIPPEDRETLEHMGQQLLEAALASALFEPDGQEDDRLPGLRLDGRVARPRPYGATMETHLNHSFTQSFPVERHAVLEGLVRLEGGPTGLAGRLRRVDLDGGFFRVMEVKVYCTVDFQNDLVQTVKATMVYEATGSTGSVRRTAELVFRQGVSVQTFRFDLASPDQRAYRYDVDVYYRDDPDPARLSFPPQDATAVVLDVDRLGILRVDVQLRDVPFDLVQAAVLDLSHDPSGRTEQMVLDGRRPSATWEAVIRRSPGPYRYRVTWVTKDERMEGDWTESASPRLMLDAPPDLRRTARVALVAAGDFSDLAQIVVELRPGPDDRDVTSLSFTAPGQTLSWEPRVADPDAFRYQLRETLVYSDGTLHRSGWLDDDRPVVVVRDFLRFEVGVIPRLLDLGGSVTLALLELELEPDDDAPGGTERTTIVLRDRSEEASWRVRLGTPDRHAYRYRLTLVARDGSRTVSDWREAQDGILVLRPVEE